MSDYNFKEIENNWKDRWYEDNIYEAVDFSDRPKKYVLAEFPYPSGKSMHLGHMMRYTVPDIFSRYLRMRGYNVMFPMGWDAFGLPAENYAIKTGEHPSKLIAKLAKYYKQSMQDMGYGIDWDREINTTDPEYYKWTQWIFLKLWEEGLAELREEPVWWSEKMKTVLAEEEVEKDEDGNLVAERDGSPVERRMVKQWVLKIPEYADELIDGLTEDIVDQDGNKVTEMKFPEAVVSAQTNWIGRSEGSIVKFPIIDKDGNEIEDVEYKAFTTRVDTLYGVTFAVIAPEHEVMDELMEYVENKGEVQDYIDATKAKTELERMQSKEKTGVKVEGFTLRNPLDEEAGEIPVYLADYAIATYGTGMVMGVPAHDERDYEFAKKFGIEVIVVIVEDKDDIPDPEADDYECSEEYGYVVNSGKYSEMPSEKARVEMTKDLEKMDMGYEKVTYQLRDWLFSRQRYWGEPMPLIHKESGDVEAVANTDDPESVEENLPVELPEMPDYSPSDDGASPLAQNKDWINTTDSEGKPATRETNTMPNWAGSCWYYMRYIDPKNNKAFADKEKLAYWLPVDYYFGGSEHTTLHLLYSRFWHKFLYDQGEVPTSEPYSWRMNGGILLGPDGTKMSKSKGNVIEPQKLLKEFGADAIRMYIPFIGPYEGTFPYNENSLQRCSKLIRDIYILKDSVGEAKNEELERVVHGSLKSITDMMEDLKMNTAVSEIMIIVNAMKEAEVVPEKLWEMLILITAPFAPFVAEELWQDYHKYDEWEAENSVHLQEWPDYDPAVLVVDEVELPVQINGKMRGTVTVPVEAEENVVRDIVIEDDKLSKYIENEESINKFIYVPGKIVNVVVK
jgi:leucyl-tRNA synthetase